MNGKFLICLSLFVVLIFCNISEAQVTEAIVGVDGFTCSLCAKGVEGQFRALDYVKSVKADIKKTEFTIVFKSKPEIKFSELSDAVTDGGFTLRDILLIAKGTIKKESNTKYRLVTNNSSLITLKGLNSKYENGDKIMIKGKFNVSDNSVTVTSIEKL